MRYTLSKHVLDESTHLDLFLETVNEDLLTFEISLADLNVFLDNKIVSAIKKKTIEKSI